MYSFFIDTIVIVFLGYAVTYPFLLWLTPLKEIDASFYRFNLGLCCIIGALGVIGLVGLESKFISKIYIWLWLCLISVSYTHLTLPTSDQCRSRWSPYH